MSPTRYPAITALVCAGLITLAACTPPGEEGPEAPDTPGTAGSPSPDGEPESVESQHAGELPDELGLGAEIQPAVDCLIEEGLAPEDYTTDRLDRDLRDGFDDAAFDGTDPAVSTCLEKAGITFETGDG
ncbi:hypothetical protein HNR23_000096 [Nocardiopsis mwathae]|uniref:Uncharacterized protein n=1 Tax=Nocardiopsis mwathae TaxID=1472723 RepID=A0A7W9YEY6_9ACTN|nr:hypothetical protein [Nocardiopsis mwathae]MBB6170036.1 hypothetical protein [Nocardiopsis mwathae]